MKFTPSPSSLTIALFALSWACGGQANGVGPNGEASEPAGGALDGSSSPSSLDAVPCPSSEGLAFEGTWSGYALGEGPEYDFTLELAGSTHAPCGTIRFGEPRQYSAATEVDVPYPEDHGHFKQLERLPGFTYTLRKAEAQGARLQFQIAYSESYRSWCALQSVYPDPSSGGYSCLPSNGQGVLVDGDQCRGIGPGQEGRVYPCAHWDACLGARDAPCVCDSGGCAANVDNSSDYFDVHFEDGEASGEMSSRPILLEKE
jgi:hypothetical protein